MEFIKSVFRTIFGMFAFLGFLVFMLIVLGVMAAVKYADTEKFVEPPDTVLTFTVSDRVVEYAPHDKIFREVFGAPLTILDIVTQLENAAEDPKVKGLLVRIAEHRLSYAQVQELREAVIAFRKTGKPAIVFADSFGELSRGMASYYLATAFDEIYLQPAGTVDISGLAAEQIFLKGLLDKIGVEAIGGTRKEYKNAWNIFTEDKFTEPHREAVRRVLDSLFEQMLGDVATARELTPDTLRSLIDRAPLLAPEALAEKLVDGVKYRNEVLAAMEQKSGCATRTPLVRYQPTPPAVDPAATVALIVAEGEIGRGRSDIDPFGKRHRIGSDTVAKAVRDAVADPAVGAIVLRVNSPGGSVVASETIWHEVATAVKDSDKPLVVTMSSVAASGGYYIAMAADRVIAEPATITGSIGVIIGKMYTPEMWRKLGITFDAEQIGRNARIFSPLTRIEEDQRPLVEGMLDSVYDTFVGRAAAARNKKPEELEPYAKGRVWTGADALRNGLVDELGGYRAAFAAVRNALGVGPDALLAIKAYPEEPNMLDLFLDREEDEEAAVTTGGMLGDIAAFLRRVAVLGRLMEDAETRQGLRAESELFDVR